ncbi:MAG: hypothetical protein QMD12_02200 [Candidatus Aenigmarchaeota archaeon]|nr:hypothetical protein [Candidatus Aenigmarchaeota archaeon]
MEETVICRLCFEPVFNFLCVNCLNKTISAWLSSLNNKILNDYESFHLNLLNKFSSEENQEKCIKCRRTTNTVLCPYCYVNEVFWWIFNKDINLAKKFVRLFDFDFLGTGYLPENKIRNFKATIIVDEEKTIESGICEGCGQASVDLKEENGIWLCESCRE